MQTLPDVPKEAFLATQPKTALQDFKTNLTPIQNYLHRFSFSYSQDFKDCKIIAATANRINLVDLLQIGHLLKIGFSDVTFSPVDYITQLFKITRVPIFVFAKKDGYVIGTSLIGLLPLRGKGMGMSNQTRYATIELNSTVVMKGYRENGLGTELTRIRLEICAPKIAEIVKQAIDTGVDVKHEQDEYSPDITFSPNDLLDSISGADAIIRSTFKKDDHLNRVTRCAEVDLKHKGTPATDKLKERFFGNILVQVNRSESNEHDDASLCLISIYPSEGMSLKTDKSFIFRGPNALDLAKKMAKSIAQAVGIRPEIDEEDTVGEYFLGMTTDNPQELKILATEAKLLDLSHMTEEDAAATSEVVAKDIDTLIILPTLNLHTGAWGLNTPT